MCVRVLAVMTNGGDKAGHYSISLITPKNRECGKLNGSGMAGKWCAGSKIAPSLQKCVVTGRRRQQQPFAELTSRGRENKRRGERESFHCDDDGYFIIIS